MSVKGAGEGLPPKICISLHLSWLYFWLVSHLKSWTKMLIGITKLDLLLELVVSFAKRNQCAVNWDCFRGQVILLLTPCREEQDLTDRIINFLLYSWTIDILYVIDHAALQERQSYYSKPAKNKIPLEYGLSLPLSLGQDFYRTQVRS